MAAAQKLCLIADTFTIEGRGLLIMTKEWQTGQHVRRGDWIELRSLTGERRIAQVKALDSVRRLTQANTVGLRLAGVSRGMVHAGDEIWSLDGAD